MNAGRYRKRPVVIDAVEWDGTEAGLRPVFDLIGDFAKLPNNDGYVRPGVGYTPAVGTLDIPTLEGTMTAQPGDWIVRGVKGECYPVKPDIFAATYEPEATGSAPAAEFLHDEWWGLAEKGWVNYHALAAAYDDPSHARGPIEACRAETCKFFVDARRGLIRAYPDAGCACAPGEYCQLCFESKPELDQGPVSYEAFVSMEEDRKRERGASVDVPHDEGHVIDTRIVRSSLDTYAKGWQRTVVENLCAEIDKLRAALSRSSAVAPEDVTALHVALGNIVANADWLITKESSPSRDAIMQRARDALADYRAYPSQQADKPSSGVGTWGLSGHLKKLPDKASPKAERE